MTEYVFVPTATNLEASWSDPAVWSGGVVPETTNADVVLPATAAGVYALTLESGDDPSIASLAIDDQDLDLAGQLTVAGTLTLQHGAQISTSDGGGLITGGTTTIGSTSSITASGIIAGPVVDDGGIYVSPGTGSTTELYIAGPVTGDGLLEVGSISSGTDDGVLELGGATSNAVAFGGQGGTLVLDQPEEFTGTITPSVRSYNVALSPQFTSNDDYVVLPGLTYADVTSFTYGGTTAGGMVTIVADGRTVSLDVAGDQSVSNFLLYAGPDFEGGEPSVVLRITPALPAPTVGLPLANDQVTSLAIVNTTDPTVTGTSPGAILSLTADGTTPETYPTEVVYPVTLGDTSGTYSDTLITPLAPGPHEIVATASGIAGSAVSAPLDLLVLPDPVAGITTADVSSFEFGSYLDAGASMQFVSGTEAIRLTDGTLSVGADTVQASVQRLYEGLLGRAGDTGGLVQFTAIAAASGTSAVADAILGSPEFAQAHGAPAGLSDTGFVTLLYNGLLGRAPDAGGLASHVAALEGGASQGSVAAGIADTVEARAHFATATANVWVPDATGALVTELYQTAFGHAPDLGGLALFTSALQGGLSAQQVAQDLASSPEFLADHDGLGNAALVTSLYENGLGRAPSAADLQHWAGASTATVLFGVAASPEAAVHLIRNV